MAEARYEILVPAGANSPVDVSRASAKHLHEMLPNGQVHTENVRMVWIEGQEQVFVPLVYQGEDSPEADSYVKQTAAYIGDVCNVESIIVTKNGKQGIQTWPIRNTAWSSGTETSSS